MKTYNFPVVVEPDEDRWFAYSPPLLSQGGSTWGNTRQEALENLKTVVKMVLESLISHGDAIPAADSASQESTLAVTI